MQHLALALFLTASASLTAQTIMFPTRAGTDGRELSTAPFSETDCRFQQIMSEALGRGLNVRQVAFRREGFHRSYGPRNRMVTLSMRMGGGDFPRKGGMDDHGAMGTDKITL